MKAGVPKEIAPAETRVAVTPETVGLLQRMGLDVLVEAGAGASSFFADEKYAAAGAEIVEGPEALWSQADLVLKVAAPATDAPAPRSEAEMLRPGQTLVALLAPAHHPGLVRLLAERGVTALSLDAVPRIARAQSMDVLSSMGTIAGYKAVLLAANHLARICPMLTTAAGTIRPAHALVIGAGVAGLQAIATARRVGAVVTGVDVRPAAAEQVESLGARFIPMEVDHAAEDAGGYATDLGADFYAGEQEIIAPHARRADLIVATALVPGRPAPTLLRAETVEAMAPGSVIVDLAAVAGGNCELTRPDETVMHHDVTILGPTNLPAAMPIHASEMFSRNVASFVRELMTDQGELRLDFANEVIRGACITHGGEIVSAAAREAVEAHKEPS